MAIAIVDSEIVEITDSSALASGSIGAATAGNLLITTVSSRWGASGPVGTFTPPAGYTLAFEISPMEAHTAALAYKVAAGGETAATWTSTGTRDCAVVGLYEFSGITDPVLDKTAEDGSGTNSVSSIATGSTGTLGASVGLAFLIGLHRHGDLDDRLSNDGGLTETRDNGVVGTVGYGECHAWDEFSANTAYNVTVTSSEGSSRMGAGIATFIEDGGAPAAAVKPRLLLMGCGT